MQLQHHRRTPEGAGLGDFLQQCGRSEDNSQILVVSVTSVTQVLGEKGFCRHRPDLPTPSLHFRDVFCGRCADFPLILYISDAKGTGLLLSKALQRAPGGFNPKPQSPGRPRAPEEQHSHIPWAELYHQPRLPRCGPSRRGEQRGSEGAVGCEGREQLPGEKALNPPLAAFHGIPG